MTNKPFRVGTRDSILALTQTRLVIDKLSAVLPNAHFEIVKIKTSGDILYDQNLALIGGKGLFLKEIEEQLLNRSIDIAVHSMKDAPAALPTGLVIPAVLEREDVRDVFLSDKYSSVEELPYNARVGSSSTRRKASLLAQRPDLEIVQFRGNIPTRLRKLYNGEVEATILAIAGVNRLQLHQHIKHIFSIEEILPAIAQGAIGIECRANDAEIISILQAINHQATFDCITIERDFLLHFSGDCTTPIAAYARFVDRDYIAFDAIYYSTPGPQRRFSETVHVNEVSSLGSRAAKSLLHG